MSDEAPQDPPASKTTTPKTRATPRPRAVQRKTKAEREEHARKEAERAKERQTTEVTPVPKPAARGARGAARGGRVATKQNERSTTVTAAAGVFGAGRGEKPGRSKGPVDLGISEALDGNGSATLDAPPGLRLTEGESSAVGTGGGVGAGGVGGARGRVDKQDVDGSIPLHDEDIEDAGRRDIELIGISSDDDDDVVVSHRKGKQRRSSQTPKSGGGLRPVRAARTIVEEDPHNYAYKKKIKKTSDDNAVIDVDTEEMQLDEIPGPAKDVPSSPELGKKPLRKSDSKTKDPRILTETVEERAERLRLNEDAEGLRDAFLHKSDTDDTVDSKEQEEAVFGRTDHDRMFLFQLPPLVPQLYDPTAKPPPEADAMDVDQPNVQVKTEPGTAVPAAKDKIKNNKDGLNSIHTAQSLTSQRLPPGFAGKLKIHKSGKVTLDWGGTDMEVRYGTEVDFLQDIVCVTSPEAEETQEGAPPKENIGKAYALGQVQKKMVLIPDWNKLYA